MATRHLMRAGSGAAACFVALGVSAAYAGGTSGKGASCNCTPPPPSTCCSVPTGHDVYVPGVNVTTPTITVNTPTINITAPTVDVQSTSVSYSQASASASSDASANASGSASGFTYANALSAANAASVFGGGGGGYSSGGGGSSYVPALTVVEGPAAQRACTEMRTIARMVAVQAVCLDDKAIPHPASQVEADRQVAGGYDGEVFRCIAGTHMQYTLGVYAGAADFSHGQTVSCLKGEALYHAAGGALACRPQRPARDCNERSLLRRYGAGIKLIALSARQCVAWSGSETASTGTSSAAIAFDGGVGGP